jgi:uncharacterized protein (DUF2164 family)
MTIDDARRERLTSRLKELYRAEFDEELSDFRADRILDFFLDGEVYQPESP